MTPAIVGSRTSFYFQFSSYSLIVSQHLPPVLRGWSLKTDFWKKRSLRGSDRSARIKGWNFNIFRWSIWIPEPNINDFFPLEWHISNKPWTPFIAVVYHKCTSLAVLLSVTLPGGENLSPVCSSGLKPAADWWFSSFLNTPSHSCGWKAALGCFVVTSVSRTAGCSQKEEEEGEILQFDVQRARLQRSFAAGDPDTVIRSDQRLITPLLFFYYPPQQPQLPNGWTQSTL